MEANMDPILMKITMPLIVMQGDDDTAARVAIPENWIAAITPRSLEEIMEACSAPAGPISSRSSLRAPNRGNKVKLAIEDQPRSFVRTAQKTGRGASSIIAF
jgi:hypothetical protein